MANPFDYQSIQPLMTSAETRSGSVFCRFTCPVTGRSVSASAELRPVPQKRDLEPEFRAGVLGGLRRSLAATLNGVLGSSEHAAARMEVSESDFGGDTPIDADEEMRRYAVARAFRSVSSLFRWEIEKRRWVALDAKQDTMTRFESQLAVHPVRGTDDLPTLLAMLVSIARSDGNFDEAERKFLAPFAASVGLTVADLEAEADPTAEEVGSVDPSRAKSVLMICWAAALADGVADPHENELLARFAKQLGLSEEDSRELRSRAQYFLLERTLEEVFSDFHMSVVEEDTVIRMGQKLGLPLAETQNAIQKFRERRGFA